MISPGASFLVFLGQFMNAHLITCMNVLSQIGGNANCDNTILAIRTVIILCVHSAKLTEHLHSSGFSPTIEDINAGRYTWCYTIKIVTQRMLIESPAVF
jgi:hypothetical protein